MQKTVLYVLGAVLILVGLLGFVSDSVLGLFAVDAVHNVIHLITGAALVYAGMKPEVGARVVQVFAVIYALVALIGLFTSGDSIFGLFVSNIWDDVLHVVLAALLVWLGFFNKGALGNSSEMSSPSNMDTPPPARPQA